jgi:hypothetical protein
MTGKKYSPTPKEAAIAYILALLEELPPDESGNEEFRAYVLADAFPEKDAYTQKFYRNMGDAYYVQVKRIRNMFAQYLESRNREREKCQPTSTSA